MTIREQAAAIKGYAADIDVAIEAKGGTTAGGLINAAKAISTIPSGGGSSGCVCRVVVTHNDSQGLDTVIDGNAVSIRSRDGHIRETVNGTDVIYNGDVNSVLLKVDGEIMVHFDGYRNETVVLADGCVDLRYANTIDASKYKTLDIQFGFCLSPDTLISMADGSVKPIGNVKVGDLIASINPDTGLVESDAVIYADGDRVYHSQRKSRWTFEGGIVVETVGRHRFFNVELGEMMYLEAWNLGEHAHLADGRKVALVSREDSAGNFDHCTIFTSKWNNYFANGILCGNRKSAKLMIGV